MTPGFFFEGGLLFAIEDKHGVIMFVRVDVAGADAIMHIQFDEGQRRRTALALANVYPGVRSLLIKAGVKAVSFESQSPSLIKFCCTRLGFHPVQDSQTTFIDRF